MMLQLELGSAIVGWMDEVGHGLEQDDNQTHLSNTVDINNLTPRSINACPPSTL